jgi:hypothetical protein
MHLGSIFFWEFLGVKRIAIKCNVDTRGVCNRIRGCKQARCHNGFRIVFVRDRIRDKKTPSYPWGKSSYGALKGECDTKCSETIWWDQEKNFARKDIKDEPILPLAKFAQGVAGWWGAYTPLQTWISLVRSWGFSPS